MYFKKSLAVLLAAGLIASLGAGCSGGGSAQSSSAGSAPASSAAPSAPASSQASSASAEALDEGNLNKTGVPILKQPEEFTIMIKKAALSKNTYPEKEPIQQMEQETNVKINWQEIAPSGWAEKVNLSFASNELPDAFISGIDNSVLVRNMAALVPIGDYVDEYAPSIKKLWEERPDIKSALTAPDGKIYSFNTGEESAWTVTNSLLYINKTWLDKLNLAAPTTTEEFLSVLEAFKSQDPNGNGQADEIPFTFCQQDNSYNLYSMFGSFGVLDNADHIYIEDGKILFSGTQPGFFEALKYFNSLVNAGVMDVEGFSQTLEQLQAKGKNSDVLLGAFISYNSDTATGDNCDNYIAIEPLNGTGEKILWNREGQMGGNKTGFVVTKACKNPEALVRWHDYINSSWENKMLWSFGPEGQAWKFNEDGLWIQNNDNLPEGASWGEYRHTVAPGSQANFFFTTEDGLNKRLLAKRTQERLDAITTLYEQHFPAETLQKGFEDEQTSNDKNMLFVEIDSYLKTFVANSIMKGVTDAQWEEHLKKCESLKAEQYASMWQTFYDSHK